MAKKRPPPPPRRGKPPLPAPVENGNSSPTRNKVRKWEKRLRAAHRKYDAWAERFEVKRLEHYYEGKQWKGLTEAEAAKKYVLNMFFATTEAQLPTLLFSKPKVEADARPSAAQIASSDVGGRATTIEQLLQTLVDDPDLHFTFITTLALRDAYPRFGVIEIGYTADFIDNPNAGKPVLNEQEHPVVGDDDEPVTQPKQVIKPGTKESIYLKRIPPQDFRCGPGTQNLLPYNDWYAIGEWADLQDVKKNPHYKHTDTLKATGKSRWEEGETEETQHDRQAIEDKEQTGKVRLWKIYDLRTKVRHVIAEGHPEYLVEGEPCPFPGHAILKFHEKADSFYPIPPLYNWMSPQDELNESREMARVHRRRAIRRYMRDASLKTVEFEKLETGEDMVVATVPDIQKEPIRPIQDAELGQGFWLELRATKDDFATVSGATTETLSTPQSDTATQANIANSRQQLRESSARQTVALWLGEIVRLMLLNVKEYMQLAVLVKKTTDPFSFDPETFARKVIEWIQVKVEDIEDLQVDVRIDVTSLSPVAQDIQRAAWNVILGFLTNPQLIMVLFTPHPAAPQDPSPLLRKTLALNGVTNEAEVREIWRIGVEVKTQMAMMALATAAQKGGMPLGMSGGFTPTMSLPGPGNGSMGPGKPTAAPGGAV